MRISLLNPFRLLVLLAAGLLPHFCSTLLASDRPNILWLSCEDISPHLGCYGDPQATTPVLDQLAWDGMRYENAFVTAGVCAPCRSAIISGMYQTTLGTHHMRCKARLPDHVKLFPQYLREAGYYCTNNSKTDYQLVSTPKETWDESSGKAHWRKRKDKNQPFFAVFNYTGCHESGIASTSKYESVTKGLPPSHLHDPGKLTLPPYYPDTPVVREDWKRYYDVISAMDRWAGGLLKQLEEDGLADNTIVLFWSDHGVGLPRAKRWLYDSGMHVPLIIRIPEPLRQSGQGVPGTVTDELVSLIDLAPTMLNLAGIEILNHMQGRAFLGDKLTPQRQFVYGARDRMDERYDIIRAVRDKRYKYLRNYEPFKTYYQYMNTPEKGATMREIRRVDAEGDLPPAAQLFMAPTKPVEELYDLEKDPHELHNLADSPNHQEILTRMRKAHLEWVLETKDLGLMPEPEIVERERRLNNRFGILRQTGGETLMQQLRDSASLALEGTDALPQLVNTLSNEDAAVRYWAAIGLGNLGAEAVAAKGRLLKALNDPSPSVRIAAARALCIMDCEDKALPVLIEELGSEREWVRLNAAIVLDGIGDKARPAIPALKEALKDKKNKYVVRVANRALNVMQGTDNAVK